MLVLVAASMYPPASKHVEPDNAIRETDTDAAQSRLSAVRLGYLTDPYITPLVPRARFVPSRAPLMNVGTYVRSTAIDMLVEGWLDALGSEVGKKQIVSLGAGSDTRFWRLMDKGYSKDIASYVELDFAENTSRKAKAITQTQALRTPLGSDLRIERGGAALRSEVYHLLPIDLRGGPSVLSVLTANSTDPSSPPLNPNLPTLFIAECVFVYMAPSASAAIVRWFAETFNRSAGIVYEMFGLEDSFGRVLKDNLKARHIELPGVDSFPTLGSQTARFSDNGMAQAKARTLKDIRRENIPDSELQRISRLEHLDEIEELELVLAHYAITWGYSDCSPTSTQGHESTSGLETWALPVREIQEDDNTL